MTRPSPWNLLRPRWMLLLTFTIAISIAMVLLGRWQWRSGRHTGDITNYSYAFQWWAFTVFAIIMYVRLVRDFLGSEQETVPDLVTSEAVAPPQAVAPVAYLAYTAAPSVTPDDDDPERARFNRYLASLYDTPK